MLPFDELRVAVFVEAGDEGVDRRSDDALAIVRRRGVGAEVVVEDLAALVPALDEVERGSFGLVVHGFIFHGFIFHRLFFHRIVSHVVVHRVLFHGFLAHRLIFHGLVVDGFLFHGFFFHGFLSHLFIGHGFVGHLLVVHAVVHHGFVGFLHGRGGHGSRLGRRIGHHGFTATTGGEDQHQYENDDGERFLCYVHFQASPFSLG